MDRLAVGVSVAAEHDAAHPQHAAQRRVEAKTAPTVVRSENVPSVLSGEAAGSAAPGYATGAKWLLVQRLHPLLVQFVQAVSHRSDLLRRMPRPHPDFSDDSERMSRSVRH